MDYNLAKLGIDIKDIETKSIIFQTVLGEMSAASILFSEVLKTSFVGPDGLEEVNKKLKVIQRNAKGAIEEVTAVFKTVNGKTDLREIVVNEKISGGQQEFFKAVKKSEQEALKRRQEDEKQRIQSAGIILNGQIKAADQAEKAEQSRLKSIKAAEDSLNRQRMSAHEKMTKEIIASERKAAAERKKIEDEQVKDNVATANAMLRQRNKNMEADEKAQRFYQSGQGVNSIVSGLGGKKPGFSSNEVARLDSLKTGLQNLATQTGVSKTRLDELFKIIQLGLPLGNLVLGEQKVVNSIQRIIGLYNKLEERVQKANDKIKAKSSQKAKDINFAQNTNEFVNQLSTGIGNLGNLDLPQKLKLETAKGGLESIINQTKLTQREVLELFNKLKAGTLSFYDIQDKNTSKLLRNLLKLLKAHEDIAKAQAKAKDVFAQGPGAGGKQTNLDISNAQLAASQNRLNNQRQRALNAQGAKEARDRDREYFNQVGATLNNNIQGKLGGLKGSFASQDIAAIRSAQSALANLVVTAGAGSTRFQQLFDAIRSGTVASLGPLTIEERKAEVAMRRVIASFEDANNEGRKIEKVLITWRGLARILVVQQLHQVIGRITNALIEATVASNEFGKRIAEIQTISQSNQRSTEQWSASLAKLSNSFGTDLLKTTEAAYEAISNQIAHGAQVTTFMAEALDFARVASISAEQAVNLLSSSINAYGKSSNDASAEAATFFKIIDLGRIRAGDIANTFGNTASLASQMGVKLEEVGAALSTLTRQGIRPDTSMTLLNNVILKLLKPTEEMKILLDSWGFSSGEAAVKTLGFVGVLRRLNGEMQKGGLNRAGELFSDLRAIRGIGGLGGDSFASFESDLSKITGATDEYKKSVELTANTINFKLSKALNEVNTLLVSDSGKRAIEINYALIESTGNLAKNLKPVFDGFLSVYSAITVVGGGALGLTNGIVGLVGGFNKLIPVLASSYVAFKLAPLVISSYRLAFVPLIPNVLGLAGSTVKATVGVSGLSAAMLAGRASVIAFTTALAVNPVTWVVGAVAGLTYLTTAYYDQQRLISEIRAKTVADLEEQDRKTIKAQAERLARETEEFKKSLDERFKLFFQFGAQVQAAVNATKKDFNKLEFKFGKAEFDNDTFNNNAADTYAKTLTRIQDLQTKAFSTKNIEDVKTLLAEATSVAENYNRELLKGIRDNDKEINKLKDQRSDKKFDNTLVGLSDPAKISKYKSEIAKLKKEAEDLFAADDYDKGLDKLERAFKLSEKLIDVSGKGKNGKRNRAGETIQDDIEDARIKAREQLAESLKKKQIDAKKIEQENETHLEKVISATKLIEEGWVAVTNAIKAAGEEMAKLTKEKGIKSEDLIGSGNQVAAIGKQIKAAQTLLDTGGSVRLFSKMFSDFESKSLQLQKLTLNPKGNESEIADLVKDLRELALRVKEDFKDGRGNDRGKIGSKGESVESVFKDYLESLNKIVPLTQDIGDIDAKTREAQNVKNNAPVQLDEFRRQATQLGIELKTIEEPITVFRGLAVQIAEGAANVVKGLDELGGLAPKGRASGGPLGFSSGGFLRGRAGRDNQLFRGHDGEFVVNAEAAAMFRPQLVAMNSNYQGMNNGGPITNVGDIHIHGEVGDSSQANVVQLGKQLQRAIRLGTVRL